MSRTRESWPLLICVPKLTWDLKEGWYMRRGKQPFSPVCVSWVRRLLKVGGEGAGAGTGRGGAALFLYALYLSERAEPGKAGPFSSVSLGTWLLKERWEMRRLRSRGKQPISPVCVFWLSMLIKEGSRSWSTGAALLLSPTLF
jgi:hypothetical protein